MADQVVAAETELRAHQAELEKHVAERTRQLHHLAHHDPLTQLPNRRQLSARLGGALSRANHGPAACTAVRRSRQLQIHQRHARTQLRRPRSAARGGTTAHRRWSALCACTLGGDEFTVLIEDVKSHEEVMERANEIVACASAAVVDQGTRAFHERQRRREPLSRTCVRCGFLAARGGRCAVPSEGAGAQPLRALSPLAV